MNSSAPPNPKNLLSDDPLISLDLSPRSPFLLTNCDLPPPLKLLPPPLNDGGHAVLRALRLSQTRARAAEERAEHANARIGHLVSMLIEESLHLSAHRRWMTMLEFEVTMLRKQLLQPTKETGDSDDDETSWYLALTLALCIGIAGAGLGIIRCLL